MSMELLAPAGSAAALRAAVQSGADAVYIGGSEFGARHSAENFSSDEIKRWTDYCHLYGVQVHVTVNTIIKEKELPDLQEYVKNLSRAGVDALIVQDMGAAEMIKNTVPDMILHASTQMTVTSLEGVRYLEDMGFSRVVLARELSEKEIAYICKNAKAEIEVFAHGAICMCYSGQCLMSSILGGRSGNRGRCAQPCRLPYEMLENGKNTGKGYLLSPKDMALVNELQCLDKIGVTSLKIEGRLKRPEYVSAVVGIYRKYIDNPSMISHEDMRELTDAFSRSGFTDGYFKGKLGKDMMSHETPGNSAENKFSDAAIQRARENANIRKIPVNIVGTLKKNAPLEITVYDRDGNCVSVTGTLKSEGAVNRPVDEETLCRQLIKLGNTPFECGEISVSVDDGITIPVKEINAVRRTACDMLAAERQKHGLRRIIDYKLPQKKERKNNSVILSAEVMTQEQFEAAAEKGIKRIYVSCQLVGTLKNSDLLEAAENKGIEIVTKTADIFCGEEIQTKAVMVSSPAAAHEYRNKSIYGDFRLNVFNSETAGHFSYMKSVTLSPELNLCEIRELCENTLTPAEVIGYGYLPLMIMRNCPVKAMGKCQKNKNIYTLRDRKKQEFQLLCGKNCRAVLLNSKPVYMADKIDDLIKLKINSIRLIFTVENFSQCGKIIDVYSRALDGEKADIMPDNSYTRGHFYRGVL
ncbi:MAG: U32 family peptidase [Clostridia bacterium]|nr:U32 family peptidase [Clostridia bacterium]